MNPAICYVKKRYGDVSDVLSFKNWVQTSGESNKVPSRIAFTEKQSSNETSERWGYVNMEESPTTTVCYWFKLLLGQTQLSVHDDPTVGSVGHYLGHLPPGKGPKSVLERYLILFLN